jgi:hypothetical protein
MIEIIGVHAVPDKILRRQAKSRKVPWIICVPVDRSIYGDPPV